jgi:hypothetical protein
VLKKYEEACTKHVYSYRRWTAEYKTKILQFQKFIFAARKKSCFELGQIGNMDEHPVTFDVLSNKTGH